jgi:hypothetical protein
MSPYALIDANPCYVSCERIFGVGREGAKQNFRYA